MTLAFFAVKTPLLFAFCLLRFYSAHADCNTKSLSAATAGMTVSLTRVGTTTVDASIFLGQDTFPDLVGMVTQFAMLNVQFTDSSTIHLLEDEGWASNDQAYGASFTLYRDQNKVLLMFSRDACNAVSGLGTTLKLRLNHVNVLSDLPKTDELASLVLEVIVDMRPDSSLTAKDYLQELQAAYTTYNTNTRVDPEHENSDSLFCYPNPASDIVSVYYGKAENGLLQIYDAHGKEVFQTPLAGRTNVHLDLSFLKSGIYFLRLVRPDDFSPATVRLQMN